MSIRWWFNFTEQHSPRGLVNAINLYDIKLLNWNAHQVIESLTIILILDFCWWCRNFIFALRRRICCCILQLSSKLEAALNLWPRRKHKATANMQLMSILYNCSKNRIRTLYRSAESNVPRAPYPVHLSSCHLSGCQVNDMDTPLEPQANESERDRGGPTQQWSPCRKQTNSTVNMLGKLHLN